MIEGAGKMMKQSLFAMMLVLSIIFIVQAKEAQVKVMAPGWGDLQYELPQAGSYKLPPMGHAKDGEVLLSDGSPARLKQLYGNDKITVLSFIYTQCNDVNGCPLATFVLHSVKNRLKKHPDLSASLRMISMSFDPAHDTPEVIRQYGKDFQQGSVEWLFATAESEEKLQPTLKNYGQSVMRVASEDGNASAFAHMLRVFLIDEKQRIRNIYSTEFLHPELLITDVKTLLLEKTQS